MRRSCRGYCVDYACQGNPKLNKIRILQKMHLLWIVSQNNSGKMPMLQSDSQDKTQKQKTRKVSFN